MYTITQEQLEKIKTIHSFSKEIVDAILKPAKISINYPFKGNYGISQKFGENPQIYEKMGYSGHFGIDYLTPWGTPILACDDGEVIRADYNDGNGNFVELKHAWGSSLYLHFKDKPTLVVGEKVARGSVIGEAGNTGAVTSTLPANAPHRGTHLHFSIEVDGIKNPGYKNFIDPAPYLAT